MLLFEGKQIRAVILDQLISFLQRFGRQFIAQAVNLIRRPFGATDGSKPRPDVGAQSVARHARPHLIGAAEAQLRRGVALGGGPKVVFNAACLVQRRAKAQHVDVAQKELCLGIARVGGGGQGFDRFRELAVGKRRAGGLHIGLCGQGEAAQKKKRSHVVSLWFGVCFGVYFANVAGAQDLPEPLTDAAFTQVDPAEARLGQLLFYDPLLSGNRNISCATCHSPVFGTGDGVALSFGEGGIGLGPDRQQGTARVHQSRNAPGLWNLGARAVRALFHDGRVERADGALRTPAGARLPGGVDSVLAAQMLFPLIARTEMAGDPGENAVADAAMDNAVLAWALIADRVAAHDEYRAMFEAAYGRRDIDISHVVNALAAYVNAEFRAVETPFDRYLAGDTAALSAQQVEGLTLFYGDAGCSQCHTGPLLSDQRFHSIGTPVFGPGLTRRFDPVARDVGRMAVTDDPADAYRFRTPFLRNVAQTAPYGHNGAFATLEEVIRHHADPHAGLQAWRPDQVKVTATDRAFDPFAAMQDPGVRGPLERSISITPVALSDADVIALVAFLHGLTADPPQDALGRPARVPSDLPLD